MILSASNTVTAESTDIVSILKRTSLDTWTHEQQYAFCNIVEQRKLQNRRGAVKNTCEEFGVKPHIYFYWEKRRKGEHGNISESSGNAHANGSNGERNGDKETATGSTQYVTTEITHKSDDIHARLAGLLAQTEEIAMELEDTLLANILMSLQLRARELSMRAIEDAATGSTLDQPPEAAVILEEAIMEETPPEAPSSVDETQMEDIPTTTVLIPEIVADIPSEPEPLTVAPPPAAVLPLPTVEVPRQTREEAFIFYVQNITGVGVSTYDRAMEIILHECMQRFDQHVNGGWMERRAHEDIVHSSLETFDPREHGSLWRYLSQNKGSSQQRTGRETPSSLNSRERNQQLFHLGQQYHAMAFQLAENTRRMAECPSNISYEGLKQVVYNTFKHLGKYHAEREHGPFWPWAQPLIEQALHAHIGLCEPPVLPATESDVPVQTEQKLPIDGAIQKALRDMSGRNETAIEESRHSAFFEWISDLAEGEKPTSFMECAEAVCAMFKSDVETLAATLHSDGTTGKKLYAIMEILSQSVINSIWNFDPRVNTDIAGFVGRGFDFTIERRLTK